MPPVSAHWIIRRFGAVLGEQVSSCLERQICPKAISLKTAMKDVENVATAKIFGTSDENKANSLSLANVIVGSVEKSVGVTGRIEARCRFNDKNWPVKVGTAVL